MYFIEILKVILMGIVEGITEWLPISSTGHLILVDEFVAMDVSEEFKEMFDVVIQLGAILAVVVLYFHKLNPFSPKKTGAEVKNTWILWSKVIVAAIPAAVVGLLLDDWFNDHFYNPVTVAVALIVYGVIFILVEKRNRSRSPVTETVESMRFSTALMIGIFQILSLIPGTSRSGSTIIGGMLVGCSRSAAAEFTFFLGIPIMFGASFLKLVKFGFHFTSTELVVLLLGMATAFLVSVLAIKFLMGYIKKNSFQAFGWYRIALGILVLAYFVLR